tara:strand:+ start:829 stop:1578 length:750 start_codon:yes stop_codon:yes gene_type:complete
MTVIYTVLTNNTNFIRPPDYVDSDCEYYALTNKKVPKPWQQVKLNLKHRIGNNAFAKKTHQAFHKINSHLFFPKQDTIYVDTDVKLSKHVTNIGKKLLKNFTFTTLKHPFRNCFIDEVFDWYLDGFIHLGQVVELFMDNKNINKSYLTGFVVRQGNKQCASINKKWWKTYKHLLIRDQLPLIMQDANINTIKLNELKWELYDRPPSEYKMKRAYPNNYQCMHEFTKVVGECYNIDYTIPREILKSKIWH